MSKVYIAANDALYAKFYFAWHTHKAYSMRKEMINHGNSWQRSMSYAVYKYHTLSYDTKKT